MASNLRFEKKTWFSFLRLDLFASEREGTSLCCSDRQNFIALFAEFQCLNLITVLSDTNTEFKHQNISDGITNVTGCNYSINVSEELGIYF